jgi:aspartyl-tRNA(Asn)/glutamyl-tRNA(Gln) amidotransferase subunit C
VLPHSAVFKYTRENILHVARLAHLEISEAEISARVCEFNRLVGTFEKLNELKLEGIQPTSHVAPTEKDAGTPMVKDQPVPSISPEKALENAPARQDNFFMVPRMIGEEE